MARPKKNGRYLNCYLDNTVYNNLEQIAAITGKKKTTIIEDALKAYLSSYTDRDGNIKGVKAIYRDGDTEYARKVAKIEGKEATVIKKECIVIEETTMYGQPYTKILLDGNILKVPSYLIEY